ncbi:hypothetical protein [Methylosinus sp. KRF6]|uniref:hypothetical protein n=1 Tax=Methylosinus sp. KRF6 TaxID=2846853 RepID=UPI001C0CAB38|nr:hypothetical protein [Methylosinus sp. KRF6]MBU3887587.1 hypothetical protein [Methylosinus sp. KRF6]
MNAFTIVSSASHALTGTAYSLPADPTQTRLVRVYGSVNFHVRTDGGDATADDMPVSAGLNGILLNVPPGGSISVVKMTGVSDGTAWFGHVKRT